MRWAVLLLVLSGCHVIFALEDRTDAPDPPPDAPPDAPYAAVVLADGPVAYWRLGGSGNTGVPDETTSGLDGTIVGAVTAGMPGVLVDDPDTAMGFDGLTSSITTADALDFAGRAAFTAEAWVFPTIHRNYTGVVSKTDEDVGGNNKIGYLMVDHFAEFGFERRGIEPTDVQAVFTTEPIPAEHWSYVVATYDGNTLTLYVDGVVKAMSSAPPVSIPDTINPFTIGARNGGAFLWFEGGIDEVAMYDYALTEGQIQRHRDVALGL